MAAPARSARRPVRRPTRARLEVEVVASRVAAARGLEIWLAAAAPARVRGSVCVALVSDARIRTLNRDFRQANKATDVLSFPADDPAGFLGDIVIASGVARRQARAAKHPLATELKVLALHGLLHLLGYDHETDHGEMARVETRLRRRLGLPAGLIERAVR